MKYIVLFVMMLVYAMSAENSVKISEITPKIKNRMVKGNSWRKGCPVVLNDLRYLRIPYIDFDKKHQTGELLVHKKVAKNVSRIFEELYKMGYPIRQMRLVSDFKGNDWQSIEAGNTSSFNCRPVTGNKRKWSNHAYGKAIDINPIENPYISKTGYISHKASSKYRERAHNPSRGTADKALLLKNDKATKIFEKYGWKWGGDWKPVKDYQHFEYIKK